MSVGSGTSRVYLLRHAHSAWAVPGERDFDRALDARGRAEAERVASAMALNGFRPAQVLCSPAVRCVETWRIVAEKLDRSPELHLRVELYARGHEAYIDLIAATAGTAVLVVGHNPMIDEAARSLASRDGKALDGPLASGFPTGGLAVIDLPGELASAGAGDGHLAAFLAPNDL